MSSPRLPLTVTRPGLVGCLNWRWLPLVTMRSHPSLSSISTTSRTFTSPVYHVALSVVCRQCLVGRKLQQLMRAREDPVWTVVCCQNPGRLLFWNHCVGRALPGTESQPFQRGRDFDDRRFGRPALYTVPTESSWPFQQGAGPALQTAGAACTGEWPI